MNKIITLVMACLLAACTTVSMPRDTSTNSGFDAGTDSGFVTECTME